ncbi:MAG: SIMPL domain-containing protein [Isosphaerales bacterium]
MIAKCGLVAGVVTGVLGASMAWAEAQPQPPATEKGTVSGSGTVVLKRMPDLLRMKVDVIAQGKTTKEALASLKDRREAVQGQLATLGAAKDSIVFDAPQINTTVLQARQQMAMMIQARMGNRTKKSAKKAAAPVVISTRLNAEWPLKGKDVEALLLEISQLQESIKAADLAGKKDLEKLAGEDEEVSQELEGLQANFGYDPSQAQPGAATFTLVCKIAAQDHSQALADAFLKAKARAEETAKAAGAELGPLRQLGSQAQSGSDPETAENQMQAYYRMMQSGGGGGGKPAEPANVQEAQGTQPGEVVYRVTISAAFDLKERR